MCVLNVWRMWINVSSHTNGPLSRLLIIKILYTKTHTNATSTEQNKNQAETTRRILQYSGVGMVVIEDPRNRRRHKCRITSLEVVFKRYTQECQPYEWVMLHVIKCDSTEMKTPNLTHSCFYVHTRSASVQICTGIREWNHFVRRTMYDETSNTYAPVKYTRFLIDISRVNNWTRNSLRNT